MKSPFISSNVFSNAFKGGAYNTGDLTYQGSNVVLPYKDNTVDLGSSTLEFKDLYLDGTANIDALVTDTILAPSGTMTLGGTGNTNNENLTWDYGADPALDTF